MEYLNATAYPVQGVVKRLMFWRMEVWRDLTRDLMVDGAGRSYFSENEQ